MKLTKHFILIFAVILGGSGPISYCECPEPAEAVPVAVTPVPQDRCCCSENERQTVVQASGSIENKGDSPSSCCREINRSDPKEGTNTDRITLNPAPPLLDPEV